MAWGIDFLPLLLGESVVFEKGSTLTCSLPFSSSFLNLCHHWPRVRGLLMWRRAVSEINTSYGSCSHDSPSSLESFLSSPLNGSVAFTNCRRNTCFFSFVSFLLSLAHTHRTQCWNTRLNMISWWPGRAAVMLSAEKQVWTHFWKTCIKGTFKSVHWH